MADMPINEVFSRIIDVLLARGFKSIKDLPACAETKIDEHWEVAVNGHDFPIACSHGVKVPPFTAYLQFNGWPAGLVTPYDGTMAAGQLANEEALLAALREAK